LPFQKEEKEEDSGKPEADFGNVINPTFALYPIPCLLYSAVPYIQFQKLDTLANPPFIIFILSVSLRLRLVLGGLYSSRPKWRK